jgi:hypothetical protein
MDGRTSRWKKGNEDMDKNMDVFTISHMRTSAQIQTSKTLMYGLQLWDICIRRQRPNILVSDPEPGAVGHNTYTMGLPTHIRTTGNSNSGCATVSSYKHVTVLLRDACALGNEPRTPDWKNAVANIQESRMKVGDMAGRFVRSGLPATKLQLESKSSSLGDFGWWLLLL